jgi:hypothetical protein
MLPGPFSDVPVQLIMMLVTPDRVGILLISRPIRITNDPAECLPLAVIVNCYVNPSVLSFTRVAALDSVGVAVAQGALDATVQVIVHDGLSQIRKEVLHHGKLYELPLAGATAIVEGS